MATNTLSANVTADEIVAVGSTIELTLPAQVDPQSAQGAIRVVRGCEQLSHRIEVAKRGRVVIVRLDDDAIGACVLVVSELLGTKGEELVDHYRLPFTVVPISGKVPAELRVEHAVRLFIGELHVERLAPGQQTRAGYIDALKAVNRTSGEPVELAFDERGERVDLAERLAQLEKRRTDKYGRIHETLFNRLEQAKEADRVEIVVWPPLNIPAAPYEKPSDRRSVEPPEGERKLAATLRKASGDLRTVLQRSKIELVKESQSDEAVPCVRAIATVAQIRRLAENKAVGGIYFDDTSAVNDLGDSIAVARSNSAHLAGFDGTGIRVAVWEDGPSVTTNLVFADRFTATPSASAHARLTSAIVKNTEASEPHGHAPDCDLYSANSSGG